MNKLFIISFSLIICSANKVDSQIKSTMHKIDSNYQSCLDSGINMYGCTTSYFHDMDSMLNVVYKRIRLKLSQADKDTLTKKQLIWLKKRDREYKIIDAEPNDDGLSPIDNLMVKVDKKAQFINDRIYELINMYKLE